MGGQDTSVNDVGADTLTSAVVVDVGAGGQGSVRDTAKTPGRAGLGDVGVDGDNGILLNVLDLFYLSVKILYLIVSRFSHQGGW